MIDEAITVSEQFATTDLDKVIILYNISVHVQRLLL